jgi:hypothetical protein
MSAWGVSPFSDDTTCEVRDAFKAHLEAGLSHAAAEKAILGRFGEVLSEHQIACLVYFALADTEWRFGCLSDHVMSCALGLLASGGDVKYWEEDSPSDARARARTLAALGVRLATKQPALKQLKVKVQKPLRKQITSSIGSVFLLLLPSGETAALAFAGLRPVGNVATAVFRVLPWRGTGMPSAAELEVISDQVVPVSGNHEFSILVDGRKKLTGYLTETNIVLGESTAIDESRWGAMGTEILPQKVQDALALL